MSLRDKMNNKNSEEKIIDILAQSLEINSRKNEELNEKLLSEIKRLNQNIETSNRNVTIQLDAKISEVINEALLPHIKKLENIKKIHEENNSPSNNDSQKTILIDAVILILLIAPSFIAGMLFNNTNALNAIRWNQNYPAQKIKIYEDVNKVDWEEKFENERKYEAELQKQATNQGK